MERLKRLLEESKMNQAELADRLNVNRSTVTYYLKGRIPSPDVLDRIADIFDCSVDYLLGRGGFFGPPIPQWFQNLTPELQEFLSKQSSVEYLTVLRQMAEDGIDVERLRKIAEVIADNSTRQK